MDPITAGFNFASQLLVNLDHFYLNLAPEQRVQYNQQVLDTLKQIIDAGKQLTELFKAGS